MLKKISDRIKEGLEIRGMKQSELVEKTGIGKSSISTYITGQYEPKQRNIYKIAKALDVSEPWLMGFDVSIERNVNTLPDNVIGIETRKFPLLGTIAAGAPILAEEHFESYIEAGTDIRADFCIRVQGDSMINARIANGDIVFVRQQPEVEDGQIAAVLIGDEATLKRVYKNDSEIILVAENPAYKPMIYTKETLDEIRILGRAIAFQSDIV